MISTAMDFINTVKDLTYKIKKVNKSINRVLENASLLILNYYQYLSIIFS